MRNNKITAAVRTAALAILAVTGAFMLQSGTAETESLSAFPLTVPTYKFGLEQERYQSIETLSIKRGTTLSELLQGFDADPDVTANLQASALRSLDATRLVAERPYTLFTRAGETVPDYVVYEPNGYEQLVFDFTSGSSYVRAEEVTTQLLHGTGIVESNLWNSVTDQGHSAKLALGVQRAIESAISLRSLSKGDDFEMVYERKLVAGQDKGVGRVKAVRLRHNKRDVIAIHFERPEDGINGYYNLAGENMSSGFLLSPVPGARISSAYNLRRFHPVLKRRKPHYGTDYAAPRGTPIVSVTDGKVVQVSRTRGNGKFVKIKHDDTYTTQYLHMSRHVKGMRPGDWVTQGQTIGYVGSTGLATGPHVCFRFWKNGKQVNHLNQELPMGKPLPEHLIEEYFAERNTMLELLDYDYDAVLDGKATKSEVDGDKA
ncbi:MAG: M23 family metallopeptidase [Saprospiraceae bacterium]